MRIRETRNSNSLHSASLVPALFGELLKWAREHEAGPRDEIVFAQDEMGGKVFGRPAGEQGGCVRPEVFEQIAQRDTLLGVEQSVPHIASRPGSR